jgi:alpha-glucosidase (family GH31 glycosyl hydrolase)
MKVQKVGWGEHDGIKSAVTGLLSSGLSGYAFEHSDIGGYTAIDDPLLRYHRSEELLLRWTELAAFTVVFRTHEGNRPSVNHRIYSDAETLRHFARLAGIYAAWKPYRMELVEEAAETDLPVVRHPFIHYPDDPEVYDLEYQFMVGSEFMVGQEFMVAPMLDPGRRTVEVYLPAGRWVHLWSGKRYGSAERGRLRDRAGAHRRAHRLLQGGVRSGRPHGRGARTAGLVIGRLAQGGAGPKARRQSARLRP